MGGNKAGRTLRKRLAQGEFTSPEQDDLSGPPREVLPWGMDLLAKFGQVTGSSEADDKLLLG